MANGPLDWISVFEDCRDELDDVLPEHERSFFRNLNPYQHIQALHRVDSPSPPTLNEEEEKQTVVRTPLQRRRSSRRATSNPYEQFLRANGLNNEVSLSTLRLLRNLVKTKQDTSRCPSGFLGKLGLVIAYMSGIEDISDFLDLLGPGLRKSEPRVKLSQTRRFYQSHPNKKLRQYLKLDDAFAFAEGHDRSTELIVDRHVFIRMTTLICLEAEQVSTYQLRATRLLKHLLHDVIDAEQLKSIIAMIQEIMSGPSNLAVRKAVKSPESEVRRPRRSKSPAPASTPTSYGAQTRRC